MGRYVSLAVLLVLLAALGAMFYQLMAPFLLPLFLAAVTAIVAAPLQEWMLFRCRGLRNLAAGLTTGVLLASVLLPALIITVLAAGQLSGFVKQYLTLRPDTQQTAWREAAEPLLEEITAWIPDYSVPQLERDISTAARNTARQLSDNTLKLASTTVGTLVGLFIATIVFLVALYFFLAEGPQLAQAVRELIPVANEQQQRMVQEFTKVTRAVVTATMLAAVVQGLLTATALQVCGFGHFLVFLVITTLAALIPMVGAWVVWLPFVPVLFFDGHYAAAIGLLLFGSLCISLADNVVRMYWLNTDAQLHPLLALVSVLGALNVMGLWGIFLGPIIAACFTAGLKIANQELRTILQERRERDPQASPDSPESASASPTN